MERDPYEAFFIDSLFRDILKLDVWLWHEEKLDPALKLLSYCGFRLILLDLTFSKRISPRQLVRRVHAVAGKTPILLRARPEDLPPQLDPRLYGVAAVAPKGRAAETLEAIRRLLTIR